MVQRTWQYYARRLAQMSRDEARTRLTQDFHKRWDEVRCGFGWPPEPERVTPESRPAGRFFFDPGQAREIAAAVERRFPEQAAAIVRRADRICRHRFDLLGHENLEYGTEIDWHWDAVNAKRAPLTTWFRIPYLDFTSVGDHKVVWELNRHQHLVTLAKAWLLTSDEKYAGELVAQWRHWHKANPYPRGINWASSLEVAFRSLSWLWVLHLLGECSSVDQEFMADLRAGLGRNARHINCYLSTYFAPNTHLLGEGVALLFIGTICEEFASCRQWRETGWRIVLQEARRQVQPDGMHFEQSVYYHVYALDFFLHARILAGRNGVRIPPWFDRTIERMAEALSVLSQAGLPPRFGDDDGGRVFDGARNRTRHLLDPLATCAALFGRGDFKAACDEVPEETLWLLGEEGLQRYDELNSQRRERRSVRLESSGLCCLFRESPATQQVIIDAGHHGMGTGGHGHADALSLQFIVEGKQALTDPGTFCYPDEIRERDAFRVTSAHNTLEVDGLSQAEPAGPFSWRALPESTVERWSLGQHVGLFVGSHNGYQRAPGGVTHRRWVAALDEGLLFVRDVACGLGRHQLDSWWHIGPEYRHTASDESSLTFQADNGSGFSLLTPTEKNWSRTVLPGEWSPAYGQRVSAPVVRFSVKTEMPAEFALLLLPCTDEAGSDFRRLEEQSETTPSVYRFREDGAVRVWCCWDGDGTWQWRSWRSDAAFLCSISSGATKCLFLAGVSYFEVAGKVVLQRDRPLEHWEWAAGDQGQQPAFSEPDMVTTLETGVLAAVTAV